jgi:integrase
LRDGENPARWAGHLSEMLPSPAKIARKKHHAALPYAGVPAFMQQLRQRDELVVRALELTILCATRTGETVGATWDEFNLETKSWTIPAERMKAGAAHRLPLSDRAIKILRALPRNGVRVFPLPDAAMRQLLARDLCVAFTVHGFRATFRTWCSEQTNYPREICEQALAHTVGSAAERAYARSDLFQKRARLMQKWADFCAE